MLLSRLFLLGLASAGSGAVELTRKNWDEMTMGKTAFVKFFAPWCGHCKKMKPDWDRLMEEYEDSRTIIVGDVDCIGAGKELCKDHNVRGYPTIKHGDPTEPDGMAEFPGERTYSAISKFAAGLKPQCTPRTLEHCQPEDREFLQSIQRLSDDEIVSKWEEIRAKARAAEAVVEARISDYEKLQKREAWFAEVEQMPAPEKQEL